MSATRTVYPHLTNEDSWRVVDERQTRELLNLADTRTSLPSRARQLLADRLISALSDIGLSTNFLDVIRRHDAVMTGSFAENFATATFLPFYGSLCVVVGNRTSSTLLSSLARLPSFKIAPVSLETNDGHPSRQFVHNVGVRRVYNVSFASVTSVGHRFDLLESVSASPFLPILNFHLSHSKVALTGDAYIEFHPSWNASNTRTTFLTAAVIRDDARVSFDEMISEAHQAGYNITSTFNKENIVDNNHICHISHDCPLTLRATTDGGILFVPFTEIQALRSSLEPISLLSTPVIKWRHGGRCPIGNGSNLQSICFEA